MAMGKHQRDRPPSMWVATTGFPTAASHPFYSWINRRASIEKYAIDLDTGATVGVRAHASTTEAV